MGGCAVSDGGGGVASTNGDRKPFACRVRIATITAGSAGIEQDWEWIASGTTLRGSH